MEKEREYKILVATGIEALDLSVAELKQCNVLGRCQNKETLREEIRKLQPHLVLLSDLLPGDGSIPELLIQLKREHHYVRFIYLAGQIDLRNQDRIDELGRLVLSGIYDIYISEDINLEAIEKLIQYPTKEETVSYLAQNILNNASANEFVKEDFLLQELPFAKNADDTSFDNLYVFTSIKPGTGKSFLSVNMACGIAAYGRTKIDGTKPKVALVEADLQTLSIGTILNIEEDKRKNMKAAMEAISTVFDKGNLIADADSAAIVKRILLNCMIPYKEYDNLHVLTGSTLTPEEISSLRITPEYYIYLLEILQEEYDIVIVDTNSSMFHVTTYPILQKAANCFYILNLDINNIRNNLRYYGTLKKLGLLPKIRWVMNENIENTKEFKEHGVEEEKLEFTAMDFETRYFKLSAKIPVIAKSVFLNRNLNGTPLVLDDKIVYTQNAKNALLDLAAQIWPIDKPEPAKEKKGFFLFRKNRKKR